ncbi:MAG: DEAD/DEAH box helicase [Oscillospiraceae bacterium]|nr:DEAD/DEAH box helicase [Oscillospiraceae bacterium]
MTFKELGLIPPILKALTDYGYETPSPIQEAAIPPALEGRDVLGCAQTGTGKTCAFATPILQRLQAHPAPKGVRPIRALILTPTRELALQIQENIAAYAKHLPLRSTVIFGGVGQAPQVDRLQRGVDVLVATPGRLCDLYNQGFLNFSKLETFVLDEADRMLDMGFIHDVRKILGWLPAEKQTLFFSATMPQEITELVGSLLHDPVRVAVDPISSPVEVIDQSVYFVDKGNKTKLLADLFRKDEIQNALIFTRTKHGANKVAGELQRAGIPAAAIHGNKSQTARQQALADFKAGRVAALVATDIAARGLDIEALSHVFNYNMPDVPETYVHRIGRTGRAGHTGVAISFCDYSEKENLRGIERLINKKIRLVSDHPWPMQVFELTRDSHGRVVCAEDVEAKAASREHKRTRNAPSHSSHRAQRPAATMSAPSTAPAAGRAGQEKSAPRQRPNPLAGERVMDATARLLSSRAPAKRDAGRTAAPQAKQVGHPGARKQQRPTSGGTAKRGRGDQRRNKPELRRSNQKDSTEQPSLMKPYYLNDEK